jgi:hypothetical protein
VSEPAGQPVYVRYQDFLDADPRRKHDALELGTDWRDGDARYRVCWYEQTHELTAERLSPTDTLAIDDFYHGISGPIEILSLITSRDELAMILGNWPNIAPNQPRTLAWLKQLLASDHDKLTRLPRTRK